MHVLQKEGLERKPKTKCIGAFEEHLSESNVPSAGPSGEPTLSLHSVQSVVPLPPNKNTRGVLVRGTRYDALHAGKRQVRSTTRPGWYVRLGEVFCHGTYALRLGLSLQSFLLKDVQSDALAWERLHIGKIAPPSTDGVGYFCFAWALSAVYQGRAHMHYECGCPPTPLRSLIEVNLPINDLKLHGAKATDIPHLFMLRSCLKKSATHSLNRTRTEP